MSIVNQYRVYCIQENTYVTAWGETAPTLCPNDHVDRSIDTNFTTLIQTKKNNIVDVEQHVDGYYQATTKIFNIPSGTPGTVVPIDISFPMNLNIWISSFYPTSDMIGDDITVIVAPEKIIGAVTSVVNSSATDIVITSETFQAGILARGLEIELDDGVNKDSLGRIIDINPNTFTLTVETPTVNSFAIGTPVKMNLHMIKDVHISGIYKYEFASKGLSVKSLPKDIITRILYTNNSGTAKTLYWNIEYNYY